MSRVASRTLWTAVDYSSPFSFTKSTVGITKYAEICIGYLNAWAGEGGDRSEVRNAKQDNLVSTVADNCNNTDVVI